MTSTPAASPATDYPPLGPEDFDALDHALDAMRERDHAIPQWEFCEGFMAALICTRRTIAPAEYWPVLLGADFVPAQHMEFVWRWQRRWREIEAALDADVQTLDDEGCYQPEVVDMRGAIAAMPEAQPADVAGKFIPAVAQIWALGFMFALEIWPEEWVAPRDREMAQLLDDALAAIVALTGDDTGKPALSLFSDDGPPSVSDARLDDFGAAIWAVYDLRLLWKSLGPRAPPLRKAPEPGRNDACPCGSGKKYKKCHGG